MKTVKETDDIQSVNSDNVLRDLDFTNLFPNGIQLSEPMYTAIITAAFQDSFLLEKIESTDYSLLIGYRPLNPEETWVTYDSAINEM